MMNKLPIAMLLLCSMLYAQVGINTNNPNPSSVLDVVSTDKGILIPRVVLNNSTQKLSLSENAVSLLVYNIGSVNMPSGFYSWDGLKWVRFVSEVPSSTSAVRFFYMPSIVIETKTIGQGIKRNLYAEYVSQFANKQFVMNADGGATVGDSGSPGRDTFVKSVSAPATISVLPNPTDLYYYITDYDKTAIENLSIADNGVLTYDVKGTGTDYSFVNIVFVVK